MIQETFLVKHSSFEARIGDGSADCEVIDHLPWKILRIGVLPAFRVIEETEKAVHIVIVKCADSRGVPAERFRTDVQPLPDRTGLEERVSISAIAEYARRVGKIRDHRNGEAPVAGQRLLEAEDCRDTLDIAAMKLR
jgi:hypothetical protein